jgi:4-amino-4-deoxy-L-arabinose transferase-like glycosyltransferase
MQRVVPSPDDSMINESGAVTARCLQVPSKGVSFDRQDLFYLIVLLLFWVSLFLLRNASLPLQIWDESRLANTALEMVRSGHWLVPSYGGIPDHWSDKPPLLIWQIAALIWLGVPPLLAVRLPTMLAALATVGGVWVICRYVVHDRAAAALASVLLLSSSFFTHTHVARTGDYDVPLSLLTLLYVLAFWRSIEQDGKIHLGWFATFAAALVLAVMTKGPAGIFGLFGLFVFSLMRRCFITLLANFGAWSLMLLAILLCMGYYGSRELYDPGYLQAVWQNELGGRVFTAEEKISGGLLFYIYYLIIGFEPGVLLSPTATLTLMSVNVRRRSLVLLCLVCAATILVVITAAQTKHFWYATPILPFLAIASALGVTDGLRWIKAREARLPKMVCARHLQASVTILLAVVSAASIYYNQVIMVRTAEINGQLWYGVLFDELQARGSSLVTILDGGVAGNYNPVLKFYADIARMKGMQVKIPKFDTIPSDVIIHNGAFEGLRNYNPYTEIVRQKMSSPLPLEGVTATCDPRLVSWLRRHEGFSVGGQVHSCIFGVVDKPSLGH